MTQDAESAHNSSGPNPGHSFSVYGYEFTLRGGSASAIAGLASDFAYFRADSVSAPFVLDLNEASPNYTALPECDASVYTPRNVVYRMANQRVLDYGGRGLGIVEAGERRFSMTSEDPDLVYEAGYLFLLSQIGEYLDGRQLHRLHALAMSYRGRAILVLLPMGGGKSTLGAALLKIPDVEILSDDSPFIGRDGSALAYPLRLGLLKGREHEVPSEHVRKINRMEFGPKFLVDFSYFAPRVVPSASAGLVLLGRRTLSDKPRLEPASYLTTMRAMVPNIIIGLGLFQGLEFLLERRHRELLGKAGVAFSRATNAHRLVRRSRNFEFHMGRDIAANAAAIVSLAERSFSGSR